MLGNKLILGNWKMNGDHAYIEALLKTIRRYDGPHTIGVCPPALYAGQVAALVGGTKIGWGGQDCSIHDGGAYTGECSAAMLADLGAHWCLVGHSERRHYHGESSKITVLKANRLAAFGVVPVVCVGETLEQRNNGLISSVIGEQIDAIFEHGSAETVSSMVIAYEPVWAIGTGRTASPFQAQEAHCLIRQILTQNNPQLKNTRILYGGSMKRENAKELLQQQDIGGGLVGGASLQSDSFLAIAACR